MVAFFISEVGPFATSLDVCRLVAIGGKAAMATIWKSAEQIRKSFFGFSFAQSF
jgi:hypothetical protein